MSEQTQVRSATCPECGRNYTTTTTASSIQCETKGCGHVMVLPYEIKLLPIRQINYNVDNRGKWGSLHNE